MNSSWSDMFPYGDYDFIQEMNSSNSTWPDPENEYSAPVDSNVAILQTIVCVCVVPIGILLIYGIVLYEHEGVDSQKRSIFNQLISAAFVALGSTVLICNTLITLRCWTGPLGHFLGKVVSVIRRFLFTFLLTNSTEIMIYKNLCIMKPNFILKLDDNFWTAFLLAWNCIFCFVSSNVDWYMSSSNPRIYVFISGNGNVDSATEDSRVLIALLAMILFFAISYMVAYVIETIKKYCQGSELAEPEEQNPMFNNLHHNPALVSIVQVLFIILVYAGTIIPSLFVTKQGPNGFIVGYLPLLVTSVLVVPSLFYSFNVNLRKFVLKEVKEVLGLGSNVVHPIGNQGVWSVQLSD